MKQTLGVGGLKSLAQEVARLNRGGDLEGLGKLGDAVAALCDHLTELSGQIQAIEQRVKKLEESSRKSH